MAKRTIRFDPLSPTSVGRALSRLTQFRDDFMAACDKVLNNLADIGAEYARNQISAEGAVFTGHLDASTGAAHVDAQRVAKVYSNADYAAYVEYGTGIWGEAFPHPDPESVGWQYDIHGHGEGGWVYQNKVDGNYYWTQGYGARPYMYHTKLYLEGMAPKVTADVFREL